MRLWTKLKRPFVILSIKTDLIPVTEEQSQGILLLVIVTSSFFFWAHCTQNNPHSHEMFSNDWSQFSIFKHEFHIHPHPSHTPWKKQNTRSICQWASFNMVRMHGLTRKQIIDVEMLALFWPDYLIVFDYLYQNSRSAIEQGCIGTGRWRVRLGCTRITWCVETLIMALLLISKSDECRQNAFCIVGNLNISKPHYESRCYTSYSNRRQRVRRCTAITIVIFAIRMHSFLSIMLQSEVWGEF